MYHPYGVSADNSGNVYIVDAYIYVIRKVNGAGIITTFAGTGVSGSSGDGGLASTAQLNDPVGISADNSGNVYIADFDNHKIRMVNSAGIITTFAGTGSYGSGGDGGVASAAQLDHPYGVSADNSGNVYIADLNNNVIRIVNGAGIITTFAGTGVSGSGGDGGVASAAQLDQPYGVSADNSGNVYIADDGNNKIRRVFRLYPQVNLPVSPQISLQDSLVDCLRNNQLCNQAGSFESMTIEFLLLLTHDTHSM